MKIGTLADWFGVGLIKGIEKSQKCGAEGVQIYAWNELDPLKVDKSFLEKIKKTARDCSQEITALCGELGGHGLEIAKDNAQKLKYLKAVVDCALTLGTNIITTHIGRIPEDRNSERYKAMLDACGEIGKYAKERGAVIAVETGPEPVSRLAEFCRQCEGIAINYDPANLVMVTNDDEVEGVKKAGDLIVHTHAKDGVMKKYLGPEKTYEVFATGGIEAVTDLLTNYFYETPLGEGSVRFPEYLKALKEIGYDGFLTIEREVHDNAAADILLAVEYLKKLLREI
ncbi:MAG TPA: sugar phosphate isomerase/epimerase [Clostridia bacterium]